MILLLNLEFLRYEEGASYHVFAGKEIARALSKMSFNETEFNNTDISDLNDEEKKTLADWEKNFKKYPIVGKLIV